MWILGEREVRGLEGGEGEKAVVGSMKKINKKIKFTFSIKRRISVSGKLASIFLPVLIRLRYQSNTCLHSMNSEVPPSFLFYGNRLISMLVGFNCHLDPTWNHL